MRIKNYRAYNEHFLEEENEMSILLDIKLNLEELHDKLHNELDNYLLDGAFPNHTDVRKRYNQYRMLCDLVDLSGRIGKISNELFLLTGE